MTTEVFCFIIGYAVCLRLLIDLTFSNVSPRNTAFFITMASIAALMWFIILPLIAFAYISMWLLGRTGAKVL
jgi:hypothetical protein